jgi:hypothetical protein
MPPTHMDSRPMRMESVPKEGPTVRSSRIWTGAGSAPARKHDGQVPGFFGGEIAGDAGLSAGDFLLNDRCRVDVVVQHDGQAFFTLSAVMRSKSRAPFLSKVIDTYGSLYWLSI